MALLRKYRGGLGSPFEDFSSIRSGDIRAPLLIDAQTKVSNRKIPILSFLGEKGNVEKVARWWWRKVVDSKTLGSS